ncbi:MAG: pyridoxal phosphate-dependent decarboxylase family protein, partial [Gemmatimonadaceae bacterium]
RSPPPPPHHAHIVNDPVFAELERDMEPAAARGFLALATDYLAATRTSAGPVSSGLTFAELAERFDEPLPVAGRPVEEILARLERDVIRDSNRLMHPMAMGHQVSPPLPAAIWTEPLIAALNQSVAVLEMSPTGTPLELRVVRWMCDVAGLGPGSGGTLTSGGTEATFTALLAARTAVLPDAWRMGVGSDPPVVVCGEHAHYAIARAIGELGLGVDRAVVIPSRDFRMDTSALAERLASLHRAGTRVMAVVATAGSTAMGSFDDLETIAGVCEERDIWLHVDGAHGASALFSAGHRHRLRGIERARSIAWDPHKMMLMPLSAGMLLVRDERDLERAFSQSAPYLFHATGDDAASDVSGGIAMADGDPIDPKLRQSAPDQGVRSFLCSRRVDALKLWVCLQRYGSDGFSAIYNTLCDTTLALYTQISATTLFEAVHEPECNILCFRYVGRGGREVPDAELDRLNRELRERYNRSGGGWITTTLLGGRRVLRVTVMNPRTTAAHTAALLDGLAEVGATLIAEFRRAPG